MTLSRQEDFERVFRAGTRINGDAFTVLGHRNGLAHARLGLAISRKNAARAVDRNRLKRVARESFKAHDTRLAGIDVVVLARAGAATHANRDLRDSLDRQYLALHEQCETS